VLTADGEAFAAELVRLARAFHDLYAAGLPGKHKRQCPECNPRGNPRPLAADGHEYQRRRKARQRRKSR
jgi:hypothetical protein